MKTLFLIFGLSANVMAYTYKQVDDTTILRIEDSAFIPTDPNNRDYAEFLIWKKAGGVIAAKDPVVVVNPIRDQAKTDLTASKTDTERITALIKYLGLDK